MSASQNNYANKLSGQEIINQRGPLEQTNLMYLSFFLHSCKWCCQRPEYNIFAKTSFIENVFDLRVNSPVHFT